MIVVQIFIYKEEKMNDMKKYFVNLVIIFLEQK